MLSTKYAAPLSLTIRPSRLLAGLLCFVHGGAALCLPPLDVPAWIKVLLGILVALSFIVTIRRALLLDANAIVGLVWDVEDNWTLISAAGNALNARLEPGSYVHPWLMVLNFYTDAKWRNTAVVLFPDALDAQTHRRLRVRLNLTAQNSVE
jgi:toxin CptA